MHVSREGDLVTLINVFETKPEQQQELIYQWPVAHSLSASIPICTKWSTSLSG